MCRQIAGLTIALMPILVSVADANDVPGGSTLDLDDAPALHAPFQAGELDRRFSGDGWTSTTIGSYPYLTDVAVQADGRVIAAGAAMIGRCTSAFAAVRYLRNGELDPTFGNGGRVLVNFPEPYSGHATEVLVQPDGKILVAGSTSPPQLDSDCPQAPSPGFARASRLSDCIRTGSWTAHSGETASA